MGVSLATCKPFEWRVGNMIIHSPVAIELCVDAEHLHISLEDCQNHLKTWLMVQYGY